MEFGHGCTLNLILDIWPWVKFKTHPWAIDNNVIDFKTLHVTWQLIDMAQTYWLYEHFILDLQRSRHTLTSLLILKYSIIQIGQGVKRYCPILYNYRLLMRFTRQVLVDRRRRHEWSRVNRNQKYIIVLLNYQEFYAKIKTFMKNSTELFC